MITDTDAIFIDHVNADEIDALLSLYVDLFHNREPLTTCIGFSRERMTAIARIMHAGSKTDALSYRPCWVARDRTKANRSVGFIVCDDPAAAGDQEVPDNLTEREAKMVAAVMALLEEIRGPVKDKLAAESGNCLHVSAIGVAPGYEGRGIASRLLEAALSDAQARGSGYAFAECTSPASRRLHEKFGFESLKEVSVATFAVNGECPFSDFNVDVHLMWKVFDAGKAR